MPKPLNPFERVLIVLLRCDAALLLAAMIPAVMPFAWMKEIHRQLGMGTLPDGPLIGYLTRSLSLLYAMHGAVLLFVSSDVRRFLAIVRFVAILTIAFGIWMTALDIAVGMPLFWIIGEGPFIFVLGCLELWMSAYVRVAGVSSSD